MNNRHINSRARLGTAIAALAMGLGTLSAAAPALAQPVPSTYRPTRQTLLSVGEGQMINLPRTVTNVWTSNPDVADVYVANPRQISIFGKAFGEATVIATGSDGSVVYGSSVRVSQNISSINDAIRAAMPDSNISVTSVGQIAVINGTVASPQDAAQRPRRNFKRSCIIGASFSPIRSAPWRTCNWAERTLPWATLPRLRMPIKTSSPCGRMPTQTFLSLNRPAQNTRSYSHSASSTSTVRKPEACGTRIDHIVDRLPAVPRRPVA